MRWPSKEGVWRDEFLLLPFRLGHNWYWLETVRRKDVGSIVYYIDPVTGEEIGFYPSWY